MPMTILETDFAPRPSQHRSYGAFVSARTPRILVAEDDDEMRSLLSVRLRKEGLSVIEVPDGAHLSRLLHAFALGAKHDGPAIDLVVSDVRMPGRNGLEALASMQGSESRIPFIVITGSGDLETHEEALRLGAVAVFDKPFDLDDLCDVIVDLVGS
jgi:DNA-binding NtrC family response regulator